MSIVFIHRGCLPAYLYEAMLSARFFNPHEKIFLLHETDDHFADDLGVEKRKLSTLVSPQLLAFLQLYRHISFNSIEYERFCFERWFFLSELMKQEGLNSALHLDSDVMLFCPFASLSTLFPEPMALSFGGCGHVAFLRGYHEAFLQHVLNRYADEAFLSAQERLHKQSTAVRVNLCDMTLLNEYPHTDYSKKKLLLNKSPCIIDHNINISEGFDSFRQRKRIHWRLENRAALPFFRKNGQFFRALAIHFQGRSKSRMRRYNSLDKKSVVGAFFDCAKLLTYSLLQ